MLKLMIKQIKSQQTSEVRKIQQAYHQLAKHSNKKKTKERSTRFRSPRADSKKFSG